MPRRSVTSALVSIFLLFLLTGSSFGRWQNFDYRQGQSNPSLRILSQTSQGLSVEISFPGMIVEEVEREGTQFQTLRIPGGGHLAHVGLPELPTFGRFIAVPRGAEVEIEVLSSEYRTLQGYTVYPSQEPFPDLTGAPEPEFVIDADFYSRNRFFPERVVEVDSAKIIRGCEVRLLTFMPVHYNPAKGEIKIFSHIRAEIHFRGGGGLTDERLRSPYFENLYRNLLLNYESLGSPTVNNFETRVELERWGCEYLIVTDSTFLTEAEELASWKNRCGILTWIVTTQDIGKTSSEIQGYIQTAYDTWSIPPSFVLFLGDAEFVPPNYVSDHPRTGCKVGTDLYYTTVDGADFFPDMYHGRISVDTPEQASEVLAKIIDYQREPLDDFVFYNHANIAAYFQDDDNDSYTERYFTQTSETVRDFLLREGYTSTRIYCTNSSNPRYYYYGDPLPPGITWDGDAAKIINSVNGGGFILNHRDHGGKESWGHPCFDCGDINSLSNGDKTPVVFSLNCKTGWFDNETDDPGEGTPDSAVYFCETFMRKYPGGAVGTFGHTRVSYSGYNDELCKGIYDGIWTEFDPTYPDENSTHPLHPPMYRMGTVLNFSKFWMYDKYYLTSGQSYPWGATYATTKLEFEMLHFMGDPTMEIWTGYPAVMTVSHPSEVKVGTTEMTVLVSEDDALVCASMNGEILARAHSHAGRVVLHFGEGIPDTGTMEIVVTKHNCRPYQGEVRISPGSVTIEISANHSPVIVPQGGSFGYTGTLRNNTGMSHAVDIWVMVRIPGSGTYGPLKQFDNVGIGASQVLSGRFSQSVPSSAPLGEDCLYLAHCGDYPSTVIDSSCFPFEVIAGVLTAADESEWALAGSFRGDGYPENLPSGFALMSNHPNPFNVETVIEYHLPISTDVKLEVYNLLGKKVATLVNEKREAGYKSVNWDASEVSSGLYFYRLTAGDFTETKRMMLVK
jgi:hypothetical protein